MADKQLLAALMAIGMGCVWQDTAHVQGCGISSVCLKWLGHADGLNCAMRADRLAHADRLSAAVHRRNGSRLLHHLPSAFMQVWEATG